MDEGFAQFVTARYGELLRTAYLLTNSTHAAEDLLQASLLKVMARWSEVADPMAYVRRAMVNTRASWWRRWRRELPSEDPPDVVAGDPTGQVTDRAALVAELSRLPKRMRAVLVLRYFEDLSESDTAALLDCSVGTVKSQASRGLARLRALLENTADAEGGPR